MTEIEKQGEYGEELVNKFLENEYGMKVYRNPNKFGSWDTIAITPNGEAMTIQIKACTRFITKNSFRFHVGPTGKAFETIRHCDHLICVIRNADTMKDKKYGGKIVKIRDHTKYQLAADGTLWIPTNETTTEVIGEISAKELAKLDSFKTSKNIL
jgi:hypothetical protein